MKRSLPLFVILLFTSILLSQPKREFRAAWVATVTNLDWPSARTLSVAAQKSEMTTMLDQLKASGINAIIFQVRTECDAFYQSPYEPWSHWLTDAQGTAPNPFYDPLQFTADEAHKRGMEIHAWFNPYRAERSANNYTTAANHVTKSNPGWILTFNGTNPALKTLDPGIPAVRDHVAKVIADVVRRYSIDGVHWDDYFYPYSPNSITTQDDSSFVKYNPASLARADWRRNNVNTLIKMVKDSISVIKPWVKFGISPFGIWKSGSPTGISGTSAYSELYCDAVYWMQQKYLDYLTPQLYWIITGPQDYWKLMPWWSAQMNGRHLYPGQAAYRISANNWSSSELPNQMRLNRSTLAYPGSVFFRAKAGITDNPKGFSDSLKKDLYHFAALIPPMTWKDSIPPVSPTLLSASGSANGITLQWQRSVSAADGDTARYYVVYRTSSPDTINLNDAKQIISVQVNEVPSFIDKTTVNGGTYRYAVTSVDKLHNESETAARISFTSTGVGGFAAVPEVFRLEQNYPNPFNPSTTIQFTVASDVRAVLKVYDLLGREVETVVDADLVSGPHQYQFFGDRLSSGVYLYRLVAGAFVETKRMILQK